MIIAAANYPISFHHSFEDWQQHTEKWVADAVHQGAEILLFPEYASLELVSIFPEIVRNDLRTQIYMLNDWRDKYWSHFNQCAMMYGCVIAAPSIPTPEEDSIVNRCAVFSPSGKKGYQDKLFMTRFETEEWGISEGASAVTLFRYKDITFGIQICYDIEFPIGAKILSEAGADLILVPSCTETIRGATRVHIGARARALEQQILTVVAQTTGAAPWSSAVDINYGYTGFYCTPDADLPEEGIISTSAHQQPGWSFFDFDKSHFEKVRTEGSVLNYRDQQSLKMTMHGKHLGVRKVSL
jgi:predicted amidohydrolase